MQTGPGAGDDRDLRIASTDRGAVCAGHAGRHRVSESPSSRWRSDSAWHRWGDIPRLLSQSTDLAFQGQRDAMAATEVVCPNSRPSGCKTASVLSVRDNSVGRRAPPLANRGRRFPSAGRSFDLSSVDRTAFPSSELPSRAVSPAAKASPVAACWFSPKRSSQAGAGLGGYRSGLAECCTPSAGK